MQASFAQALLLLLYRDYCVVLLEGALVVTVPIYRSSMQQKRVLADITNYTPTTLKDSNAPAIVTWCKPVPTGDNGKRTKNCIKSEEFQGSVADVTRYIVEQASAGWLFLEYLSEREGYRIKKQREKENKRKQAVRAK